MKKSLLILALIAGVSTSAYAKFEGNGYYRVQNYKTDRYLYVLDNQAEVDYGATTIDMNGVELWRGEEKMHGDAATILYIEQVGSQYDIAAQGTSIYQMSGIYLNLRYDAGKDSYLAYGTSNGVTKYLGDPSTSTIKDKSYLKDTASGDYRYWRVKSVGTADDNYFGLTASVAADGVQYAPFYGDFPFATSVVDGMKAYYVSHVDAQNAIVVASEINGTVPRATPVFVKCVSGVTSENRIAIGEGTPATVADNMLTGNYFDNDGSGGHYNRTPYNASTMRMLGVNAEGKLAYVTVSDLDFVPRNQSYLKVAAGTPAELTVMSPEEYQEFISGIPTINADSNKPFDVYNLQGIKVLEGVTSIHGLPAGIYVAKGQKYIVR